jgi:small-conductance mechanosensitive channel
VRDSGIEPLVCFTTFNEYSLDIFVRAYTFVISYQEFMEVKERILLKVKDVIRERGADIPFPTSVVDLKK